MEAESEVLVDRLAEVDSEVSLLVLPEPSFDRLVDSLVD